MFKNIKFYRVLFAIVLASANIFAQSNPSDVIERSLQAIGGKKEITKIRNIKAIADCVGPNGKYKTEIYSAKNSRLIFKQLRPNGDNYFGQTSGDIFWTKDEKSGDFSPANPKAAFVWQTHDFQMLATDMSAVFDDFAVAGDGVFAGRQAIELNAKDKLGNAAQIFFEKDSKLILGFIVQNPFNEQPDPISIVFNEWKEIGNLKLPSKVTATDKQGDFVLNFREITLNSIDEKIFEVPQRVIAINELLDLQKHERAAHFSRDAKLLVSMFADDFTDVSKGKMQNLSRETSRTRFQSYFNNSTFIEWDDISPPVIKISDDATMAYVLVHKRVRRLAKDESGKESEITDIFAWIATYRKIKGEWKLTAIASTNTPEKDQK